MKLLLVSSAVASAAAAGAWNCNLSPSGMAVTYDVNALTSNGQDWLWNDPTNTNTLGYNYTFNVCGNVNALPPSCNSANFPNGAPAFQWSQNPSTCYSLGNPLSSGLIGNKPKMSLYDPDDPSAGFVLSYVANQFPDKQCQAAGAQNPYRSLSLVFRCADMPFPAPGAENGLSTGTFVDEIDSCSYEAYSWSQAGCPTQCTIGSNGRLCSGYGICGYDQQSMAARCFCDDGYTHVNGDCAPIPTTFPSGSVAGATFGGLIIGGAAIFAYAFFAARKAAGGTVSSSDGMYAA